MPSFRFPDMLNPRLIARIERAESIAGFQFNITSDYRQGDLRSHGDGDAVDIACSNSRERFQILHALLTARYPRQRSPQETMALFSRIGIYPEHIHADVSERLDPRVIWLGDYNAS